MRPTRVRWTVLTFLFLLSIITYLDRVCINSAATSIQDDLGLSSSQIGDIFGAFALAYALFEILGGWLGDRFGPRRILTRIVIWWSAFTALTGLATGYLQLLVIRFLFGAGEAGAYPNSSAAISRWFPAEGRGQAHGLVWMASRLGGALSPLLVLPLLELFGWRSIFYIFSTFGVVWAVIWWRWFRDSPQEKPTVNEAEIALIGPPRKAHRGFPWRTLFASKNMWAIMLMYHLFCYGSFWYLVWTASYLEREKGMERGTLAAFVALPFLLGAVANLIGGFTSDLLVRKIGLKWGRRAVGAGGVGLAGLLMLLSLGIDNPYAAAFVLAVSFAASDFMLPNCWAVCLDVGRENAGAVTGAMNTAGQIGSTLVSIFYGRLVDAYGWNLPLAGIAGMSLLSALMWFLIDPSKPLSAGKQTEPAELEPPMAEAA